MYIEEKSSHFEVKEMCIWATYCVKLKKDLPCVLVLSAIKQE